MHDSMISCMSSSAADILSVALRQPIRLKYASQLRNRSDICRFEVLDTLPNAPTSVVVKLVSASDSHSVTPSDLVCDTWHSSAAKRVE
jgi:hypothetical protein